MRKSLQFVLITLIPLTTSLHTHCAPKARTGPKGDEYGDVDAMSYLCNSVMAQNVVQKVEILLAIMITLCLLQSIRESAGDVPVTVRTVANRLRRAFPTSAWEIACGTGELEVRKYDRQKE